MKLTIEEPIQESIFCHNLRFDRQYGDTKAWIKFRRANLKTTSIFWFKLSPVYCHASETLYNPSCHVMIILN